MDSTQAQQEPHIDEFLSEEELPYAQFSGAHMIFHGNNFSVAPKVFNQNIYYGERFLERKEQEALLARVKEYTTTEMRLYMALKDVSLTDLCLLQLAHVEDSHDLAHIALLAVDRDVLDVDYVVKEDFITRLINACPKASEIKGMSVDNIRQHIHRILDGRKR